MTLTSAVMREAPLSRLRVWELNLELMHVLVKPFECEDLHINRDPAKDKL
jgi:hypothetical protein